MFLGIWLCQGFLVRQLQVSLMLGAIRSGDFKGTY